MRKRAGLLAALAVFFSGAALAGTELDHVRTAGMLRCGVIGEAPDENKTDLHGNLSSLDSEICRAVAVSLFGKPAVALSSYHVEEEGLRAVRDGRLDLVVGVTPRPQARLADHVAFGPVVFWDSLAIMAHTSAGITRIADIKGKKLCAIDQSDGEALSGWTLVQRGISYIPFTFQEEGEMESGLVTGHCQAFVGSLSKLGEIRTIYGNKLSDTVILPDRLALLPAAIAYRDDDAAFGAVADWTMYALMQAEILGITKDNAASFKDNGNVLVERFMGVDAAGAHALGLKPDWARSLVVQMGNYGEVYARTVGSASPMRLPRGLNAEWTEGGLMAPMPLQ